MARARIAMVGGGSFSWSPVLLKDILLKEGLGDAEIRLLDIDLEAAEIIAGVGKRYCKEWNLPAKFVATKEPAKAFDGADFVLITISTGGLDAMSHDLRIPERYGIYQTVGDTVGPGGWARGLRNIPVFLAMAEQIKKNAPKAMILNYTNPMTTLTKVLTLATNQPVVGLCHGIFENYRHLRSIFGLKREEQLKARFCGLNHFFWILELSINGKPGYPMLRSKLQGGKKTIDDLLKGAYKNSGGEGPRRLVASELFETFGYLPYMGDRHVAEFFGHYLAPDRKKLAKYKLVQTTIAMRRKKFSGARKWALDIANGRVPVEKKASRETAADIMAARFYNHDFVDVMNLPNIGQISNLPKGAVVETLGAVNALGFMPCAIGPMPDQLVNVTMPHLINNEMIVQAAVEENREKAYQALINDPLCSHLAIPLVKKMADELLYANRQYLPRFFGRKEK